MSCCPGKCGDCCKNIKVELKNLPKVKGVVPQIAYFDGVRSVTSTPDAIAGVGTSGEKHQVLFSTETTPVQPNPPTVSAPVISFQGDDDTGIYHVESDTIGVSTGGSQELQVSDTEHISGVGGTNTNPTYNFGLSGTTDTDTGMYLVPAPVPTPTIGFSSNGTMMMSIGPLNVSAREGSSSNPSYNFGIQIGGQDDGMYRINDGKIGFSTGGVQKVGIYNADSGDFIEGLNVGTSADIAGIRRLSDVPNNSWEDGHMGNSDYILFTATDFLVCQFGRANVQHELSGANARGATVVVNLNQAGDIIASKVIPKGFRIPRGDDFKCKIYSDRAPSLLPSPVPFSCSIEVFVQSISSVTGATNISTISIAAGGPSPLGWVINGVGAVASFPITLPSTDLQRTGNGYNTVSVHITPVVPMNSTKS